MIPAPRYPLDSLRPDEQPAATSYLWIVQPGGNDQPQRLYIGTEPGGLFQSDDGGDSFQLVESLWQHSSRENWFGGGRDHPGLCSICVDPRDSNHLMVGISVGGVYETFDGGESWEGRNKGLYADYLPDPYAAYGHDPHFMVMSPPTQRYSGSRITVAFFGLPMAHRIGRIFRKRVDLSILASLSRLTRRMPMSRGWCPR